MRDSKRARDELIQKDELLREARRRFMAKTEHPKKLVETLTRCLLVTLQDEQLDNKQASELFLHVTQLFQYKVKDPTTSSLRRLAYICIKTLSPQVENVFVVTSSLTNDVTTASDPTSKAAALRALCQISDISSFAVLEPYLKQGIADKHPVVASAALSSLMRIGKANIEILRKFTHEIQEALNSDSPMVQYHALIIRYEACKNNRLAVSRLITTCIQQGLKSPLATCLLIRIITSYIGDHTDEELNLCREYIKDQLNSSSEMVEFEAAIALVSPALNSEDAISKEYKAAVSHLRNFLTSSKPALRFASVRSLNELAATSSADIRFWSVHRIGGVCKLHLLNKRYRVGDHIIGILDFSNSTASCAKYTVILQCEETQQYELKQEFSLGIRKKDFMITIPPISTEMSVLHCVLSFLFYIGVKNYPKTLYEDRAGTIELGPSEIDTRLFSCDFPIAIHT